MLWKHHLRKGLHPKGKLTDIVWIFLSLIFVGFFPLSLELGALFKERGEKCLAAWVRRSGGIIGVQPSSLLIVRTQKAKKPCPVQRALCRGSKIHLAGVLGVGDDFLPSVASESTVCSAELEKQNWVGVMNGYCVEVQIHQGQKGKGRVQKACNGPVGSSLPDGCLQGLDLLLRFTWSQILYKGRLWSPGLYRTLSCHVANAVAFQFLVPPTVLDAHFPPGLFQTAGIHLVPRPLALMSSVSTFTVGCAFQDESYDPPGRFQTHLVGHNQHFYFILFYFVQKK